MSGPGPAGDAYQTAFGSAGRQPAVGGGVPQPVRVEVHYAGDVGAHAQRAVQAVVAERLATIAEPQGIRVGESVCAAGTDVAVERAHALRPEWNEPALAALAATDDCLAGGKVGVRDRHLDEFTGPQPGLEHYPDDCLVATVAERVESGTGFDQRAQVVVRQRLDDLDVELGRFDPEQFVLIDLALFGKPRREAPQRELTSPRGRGLSTLIDQVGDERRDRRSIEHRGSVRTLAPGQEPAYAVAVALD